jgi:hypothetical protein
MKEETFNNIDWRGIPQKEYADLTNDKDPRSRDDGKNMNFKQKARAKEIRSGQAAVVQSNYDPFEDFKPLTQGDLFAQNFNEFWAESLKYVNISSPGNYKGIEDMQKNKNTYLETLRKVAVETFADKDPPNTRGYVKNVGKAPGDDKTRKEILEKLLKIGYQKYENEYVVGWEAVEAEAFNLALDESEAKFVFRCDGRDPKKIEAQDGTKCRADIDQLAKEIGFDEEWHPFKDRDSNRKEMWFRRGQSDNDLNTLVSLSPELEAAAGFPLLDEAGLQKKASDITPTEFKDIQQKAQKVPNLELAEVTWPSKTEKLYTVRSFVYVILLDAGDRYCATKALQTHYGQDAFPELGVRSVRWTHHIAMIPVRKLFLSKTKAEGYRLFFEATEVLQSKAVLQRLLGFCASPLTVKQRIDLVRSKVKREQHGFPSAYLTGATITWPKTWPGNPKTKL